MKTLALVAGAFLCARAAVTIAPFEIKIGGGQINVAFREGEFNLPEPALEKWVTQAVEAVTTYYGTFPVKQVNIRINPAPGRSGVFHGTTWPREFGSFTRISVGEQTDQRELNSDWMMTHELIHTAFPSVPDDSHWLEEGLATYVEPVARVQAGQMDQAQAWSDMIRDMPQGQPQEGDQGLDRTHTWARTYWGGALFLLAAEVRIREQTRNRKGLQDALKGIVAAGGTIQQDWSVEKALNVGDQATGTTVLIDMYREMKDRPVTIDLAAIWKKLGIERQGGAVVLRDNAPMASARRAIMAKP